MKNKILIVFFSLFLCNICLAYEMDFNGDGEKEKIDIEFNIPKLTVSHHDGSIIYTGSDFSVDGYTMFDSVKKTKNGFSLIYHGNNFGVYFTYDLTLENKKLHVIKGSSNCSYVENTYFKITIKCERIINKEISIYLSEPKKPIFYPISDSIFSSICKKNIIPLISLNQLELKASNNNLDLSSGWVRYLFDAYNMTRNNVFNFNNIAFYLYKNHKYASAKTILERVISKFPTRAVAYLNIADVYMELGEKTLAKDNYKIYYTLMKENGRANKVPERVRELVKSNSE